MFFSAYRRVIRERRKMEADRNFWKGRALELESKLQQRSDFFIEREFKLIDRFLTAKVGTYAITDQVKEEQRASKINEDDVKRKAFDDFIDEQKEKLVQYARDAGMPDPEAAASQTLNDQMAGLSAEFEASYRFLHN